MPEEQRGLGSPRFLRKYLNSYQDTTCRPPTRPTGRRTRRYSCMLSASPQQDEPRRIPVDLGKEDESEFSKGEPSRLESLEEILLELDDYDLGEDNGIAAEDDDLMIWNEESLEELLGNLREEKANISNIQVGRWKHPTAGQVDGTLESAALGLEQALLQGVVPVSAGVGSECLPGDFGFDPLLLSEVDLFRPAQNFLLNLLPGGADDKPTAEEPAGRPKALILRDYREAEIRHGRLAMLAASFWPLQELLDRFVLSDDQFGPLIYGTVTLPYFPLMMTAIMLLLGYLDIYSEAIKDMDQIGEAFLPGDCFWDPLYILQDAPDRMKRNMQERELFNGRAAMLAVAAYIIEESITHQALIEIESNALLFEPAYQVPFIQRWLDSQFAAEPESAFFSLKDFDSVDTFLQTDLVAMLSICRLPLVHNS